MGSRSEGKKIEEFRIYLENRATSFNAILRMKPNWYFSLEVNELTFDGFSPRDLIHEATMKLENEEGLKWKPIILVDPDLVDGRLIFTRLFEAEGRDKRDIWRTWRFDGKDEEQKGRWNSDDDIKTYQLTEGATPGHRHDGPVLKQCELPYTPERWMSLLALDQMLKDALASVTMKIDHMVRNGDIDGFLQNLGNTGVPALFGPTDPKEKA